MTPTKQASKQQTNKHEKYERKQTVLICGGHVKLSKQVSIELLSLIITPYAIYAHDCYLRKSIMKIYVDADACPVVAIVEQIAKEYEIPVTLLCDTNHVLYSDYSEVVTVGAGADAVDFKLVSLCHKGDIVVTQDYGVAAMILGKGAYGIHQNGKWYTNENIDRMLMERHLAKKARNAKKKHHLKGPSKRTDEDDRRFAESFTRLVEKRLKTEDEV